MDRDPTPREMGSYFVLAGIGLEMVFPAILGMYLDHWLDTVPWITAVLAVLGFAGGMFHLVAVLARKDGEESGNKTPPP